MTRAAEVTYPLSLSFSLFCRFGISRVCRLHQRGLCKFGVDCNNLHVCRQFWATRQTASKPLGHPVPQVFCLKQCGHGRDRTCFGLLAAFLRYKRSFSCARLSSTGLSTLRQSSGRSSIPARGAPRQRHNGTAAGPFHPPVRPLPPTWS
jgi:hypothetical protein